jgi:uncharacterized protein
VTLYLDSSSLVKIFVDEDGSEEVRALVSRSDFQITSVVSLAEVRSALARMRREKALTPAKFAEAKRSFAEDWSSVVSIEVSGALAQRAGDLAEKHGLRGFDSIHLATFAHLLERCEDDVEFSSFDKRMVAAARRLG